MGHQFHIVGVGDLVFLAGFFVVVSDALGHRFFVLKTVGVDADGRGGIVADLSKALHILFIRGPGDGFIVDGQQNIRVWRIGQPQIQGLGQSRLIGAPHGGAYGAIPLGKLAGVSGKFHPGLLLGQVVLNHLEHGGLVRHSHGRKIGFGVPNLFFLAGCFKFHAVEHIDLRCLFLSCHYGAGIGVLNHIIGQLGGIGHRGGNGGVGRICFGADYTGNGESDSVFHQLFLLRCAIRCVGKGAIFFFGIAVGRRNQRKGVSADGLIIPGKGSDFSAIGDLFLDLQILLGRDQPQLVQGSGGKGVVFVQNQDHLVVFFRPGAIEKIIAVGDHLADGLIVGAGHQLGKVLGLRGGAASHHHSHGIHPSGIGAKTTSFAAGYFFRIGIGVHQNPIGVVGVHIEVHMIGVNHAIFSQIGTNGAVRVIQIVLESRKIVFDHAGSNGLADLDVGIIGVNAFFWGGLALVLFGHAKPHHIIHHAGHIQRL